MITTDALRALASCNERPTKLDSAMALTLSSAGFVEQVGSLGFVTTPLGREYLAAQKLTTK